MMNYWERNFETENMAKIEIEDKELYSRNDIYNPGTFDN